MAAWTPSTNREIKRGIAELENASETHHSVNTSAFNFIDMVPEVLCPAGGASKKLLNRGRRASQIYGYSCQVQ